MTLISGYEPRGLVPIIIISDMDGTEQYRFEHPLAVSSGTAEQSELPVTGWHLHGGIGADLGRLNITVDDKDNALVDTTSRRRPGLIKPQWTVEMWLYVADGATGPAAGTASGSQTASAKWFEGLIMDPDMDRPAPNMQTWNLFAVGIGIKYADRLTSIKREQDRAANGLDFDDTDTLANASQIADDLINKNDHYPHTNITPITGFTTDFRTLNIKFADFNKKFVTIHNALQEIANRTGQIWGIRPHNKEIFMYPRGTRDSGLLITNDDTALLTTGHDKTKLLLGRKNPFGYVDSSSGFGYSFLHGVGGLTDFLMSENGSANASLDLSTDAQFAFPFTPTEDSVSKISIFADLASTTTAQLVVSIRGNDSTVPEPNDDTRRRVDIQPDRLNQKITVAGNWFEQAFQTINMGTRVRPSDTFYLVIDTHPDIRVDYQTGTGTFFRNTGSIESPTWVSAVGDLKMRIHHSHSVNVIVENTVSKKSFGIREMAIPLNDFPNEEAACIGLIGLSSVIGKARRLYKPIQTTPPQSPPLLGATVRVIDKFNGMDTFADLTGFDIQQTSFSKWNRGVDSMTIHMEEVYSP